MRYRCDLCFHKEVVEKINGIVTCSYCGNSLDIEKVLKCYDRFELIGDLYG